MDWLVDGCGGVVGVVWWGGGWVGGCGGVVGGCGCGGVVGVVGWGGGWVWWCGGYITYPVTGDDL